MIKLTFFGAARSVTGANYLLETDTTKILVDCGLAQGSKHAEDENYEPFAYPLNDIKAVLITHAHIDHTGRLPKLFKDGFTGSVIATSATKDLLKIMLEDSQGLIADEAEKDGHEPLYAKQDVENVVVHAQGVNYEEEIQISDDIKVRFRDAGHILGSAIIEVWVREADAAPTLRSEFPSGWKKIVFSGDLGNPPTPLLRPTEFIDEADYVVIESAYGDRHHEDRETRKNLLEDAIEDSVARGGTLLIPSFAIERTQELLFEMHSLMDEGRIPKVPIFIDSPMAIDAIAVYAKHPEVYNKEITYILKSGEQLFQFPQVHLCRSTEESKRINDVVPPKIIMAGSGMSTGGRILHHELRYLPDEKSTLLVVGYQALGTLGRMVLDGATEVTIFGERVQVRAQVRAIGGYSAHADQDGLYRWVEHIHQGGKLKKVFVVQGEEAAELALVQILRDKMGVDALAPQTKESFIL